MEEKNMTALISCFSRAYHSKNYKYKVFNDYIAEKILTDEEYNNISSNLKKGITFFDPNFNGTEDKALRWIVDNQLSPSIIGRSRFAEDSLKNAIRIGTKQYLLFASGYDTFAYRNKIKDLSVFEIDKNDMIEDKIKRVKAAKINSKKVTYLKCDFTTKDWINEIINSSYDKNTISFCSLLGISYYLTKDEFENMIEMISSILCVGSSIVFDYPTFDESKETKINEMLANECGEEMKAKFDINEIQKVLGKYNFLIYEDLSHQEIDKNIFYNYNTLNPQNEIHAPRGVNYCLAVKHYK